MFQPFVSSVCVYTCARQSTAGVKRGISSAVNHRGDSEWRDDTLSLRRVMSPVERDTHTSHKLRQTFGPWRWSVCCKHYHYYLQVWISVRLDPFWLQNNQHFSPWKHILIFIRKTSIWKWVRWKMFHSQWAPFFFSCFFFLLIYVLPHVFLSFLTPSLVFSSVISFNSLVLLCTMALTSPSNFLLLFLFCAVKLIRSHLSSFSSACPFIGRLKHIHLWLKIGYYWWWFHISF